MGLQKPSGSVLSVSTRALLGACESLGVPQTRLLEGAGLDAACVADPDARLPLSSVAAVWREAYRLTEDPYLALHAAEAVPFGAYKVFDYVALGSSTVGHGLTQIGRYFRLINDRVHFDVDTTTDPIAFALTFDGDTHPPATYVDYTFAAVVTRTRKRWGYTWPLVRVELACPRPPSLDEHRRVFGCDVAFGAARNRLLISHEAWNTCVRGLDAPLFDLVRDRAEQELARLPEAASFAETVASLIERAIGREDVDLDRMATSLGTTPRTLQRRLADEGTSFVEVLDRARHAAALRFLAEADVSLGEISFLLGFSQTSAFNRAFKRWCNTTPLDYRRSLARAA
jgi:AraC-like DNA-binding protein